MKEDEISKKREAWLVLGTVIFGLQPWEDPL
jgi:hypothetical protein